MKPNTSSPPPPVTLTLLLNFDFFPPFSSLPFLLLLLLPDQEALAQPHQEADERLHGLVADREAQDHRDPAGHPQRRDLKVPGQEVEDAERGGARAVHPGGRAPQAAPPAGVPGLQVPAQEEGPLRPARPEPLRDPHEEGGGGRGRGLAHFIQVRGTKNKK